MVQWRVTGVRYDWNLTKFTKLGMYVGLVATKPRLYKVGQTNSGKIRCQWHTQDLGGVSLAH